jgi:hypothetical protein
MSYSLPLRLALVSAITLAIAGPAAAQSVSVTFSNTDLPPIPLLDTSSVSIDANGNLTAQCVLNGTKCQGISGGSGNGPTATLARNNGTGDITAGGNIGLTWTVQNSADVCLATSSPAVSGWNGVLVGASGGSQSLPLSTVGTYSFGLRCFNEGGASDEATVAATVVAGSGGGDPPPGIPACTVEGIADGNVFVQPTNFVGHRLTWEQLFYGATFPEGNSHLSPIGSFTLRSTSPSTRGPTMNARYFATSFVAQAGANYNISWLGAQGIQEVGYSNPRGADAVFVSISPCAGDLRPRVAVNPGPFLQGTCRAMVSNANMFFGTTGGTGQCPLTAGQTYFINIAMVNPSDGLTLTETTCASGNGNRCEANFDGL